MRPQVYSMTDLVKLAENRQNNKFDFNIAVSGARGNGKSTFLFKYFLRFKCFKPQRDMVYRRRDVMKLLEGSKYGTILDDEAIRTGYKRNFFESDQKLLIQMMNMYRDNFNIYGMAIPNFYSLDKGVRELIKVHIQIVERGLGVIHVAQSSLYSDDCWDIHYNKKIEDRWGVSKKNNPNFKPPYHKLSTFFGYIKFGDITIKQRELYESIKTTKRKEVYEEEMNLEGKKDLNFYDELLQQLLQHKLTQTSLKQISIITGRKFTTVKDMLNKRLNDLDSKHRVASLLLEDPKSLHSSSLLDNDENDIPLPLI